MSGPVAAYVKLSSPGQIFLCERFWNLIPYSSDLSQVGTLISQASHFRGTSDYAIGAKACQALAQGAPDIAVDNADSYAYFASSFVQS
jgi:hypothetical protein